MARLMILLSLPYKHLDNLKNVDLPKNLEWCAVSMMILIR